MAIISLRAYLREIEEMLDNGHYNDAIAHCRHIIEHFPKNVHTYRLMGKALLESRRFADASDIFQRVLACVPDDFVSHLGMSIICEDEGNLDEAIWHMERAFEAQPSNVAVQDELRRLYGKRDGLVPQKIQLTLGALARLSAKSTFYSQAIAELRTALAEDPERPDLQAALAEIYAKSGDVLASIDICNLLLNKLPYCYSANFLLSQLLLGTDRSKDADLSRKRLIEIDPYCAYLSDNYQTPEQVPDDLVTLDRYVGEAGEELYSREVEPLLTSSADEGGTPYESSQDDLPEWLREFQSQTTKEESVSEEIHVAQLSSTDENIFMESTENHEQDDDIPQWLKDIGWEPPFQPEKRSEEISDTSEIIADHPTETPESEEVLQPVDIEPGIAAAEEIPWEGEAYISESETTRGEESPPESSEQEIPDWLTEGVSEAISQEITHAEEGTKEEIPDWLHELGEGIPEEIELKEESESTENVREQTQGEIEGIHPEGVHPVGSPEDLPDWLEMVFPDSAAQGEDFEIARAEIPLWLRQLEEESQPEESEPADYQPLTDSLGTAEQPLGTEKIPDWLVAAMSTETLEVLPFGKPEEILRPEKDVVSDTQPVQTELAQLPSHEEHVQVEPPLSVETSGHVRMEAEILPEEITPLSQEIGALSEEDEQAALAWLESLAARQGAIEEELLTPPEDRLAEMPEWIKEETATETEFPSIESETEPEIPATEPEGVVFAETPPAIVTEEVVEEMTTEVQEPFIWEPELIEGGVEPDEKIELATTERIEEISPTSSFPEDTFEGIIAPELEQPEEELPAWLRELEIETESTAWMPPEEPVPLDEINKYEEIIEKIDINTASLGQLERIPGVGFILAQNIINYRESSGGFKSLTDLINVPGMNADLISDLEEYLTVEVVSEIVEPATDIPELKQAWNLLLGGNVEGAVEMYSDLIRRQVYLEDVIRDLQEAVSMHASNATLYQTLGDAYVRANRLQDALTAYTRAEDLLA